MEERIELEDFCIYVEIDFNVACERRWMDERNISHMVRLSANISLLPYLIGGRLVSDVELMHG